MPTMPKTFAESVTLRDYFAAIALPAIISAISANNMSVSDVYGKCAETAYKYADAMLAKRGNLEAAGGAAVTS